MSDELHDRVTDVLDRADTGSGTLLSDASDAADGESPASDVLDAAADASDIVESSEPEALLEALGLDTLPDGTEPDSIPEAIAKGDPDDVENLRRLLHLSKLAERGDELEGAVGELRDRIGGEDGEAEETEETEPASESESEDEGTSTADDESGDAEGEQDEHADDESATDDLAERLRSSMESSLGAFSDDVENLQSKLEEAGAALGGDEDEPADETAEAPADKGSGESDGEGRADADDEGRADADESDDGLLDPDLGTGRDDGGAAEGAARHSTMAPPPSERADMRGVARFSTMPKKNRE